MTDTLPFSAVLELIGHSDEFTALCTTREGQPFMTIINTSDIVTAAATGMKTADTWFSVNTVAGPAGVRGRGGADAITKWCAAYADLDIKEGGCDSLETAHAIIDDLSQMLGTAPTVIIASGHGLQPLWPIDDGHIASVDDRARCAATLKRFGRLVAAVASRRGAGVDSVFDLPRILRVPGTVNHKAEPVDVVAYPGTGVPLSVGEIIDALDEWGVEELASDDYLAEPIDPSTYAWAQATCPYVSQMISAWQSESPAARHPWLMSQATRLAAARRYGCLDEAGYRSAVDVLTDRMRTLCENGSNARALAPSEVRDALSWGETRIATLADSHLAGELGNHSHTPRLSVVTGSGRDNIAALAATAGTAALAPAGKPIETTMTDHGNSQQLVHRFGDQLRYSPSQNAWLSWDGTRWRKDEDNAMAIRAALETAEDLPEETKEQVAHKRKTLSRAGIDNMIALARAHAVVRVTADEMDSDPYALNTIDGTINLRTGEMHEHRPRDNNSKVCKVGYAPDMPIPRWEAFLDDTFGDAEMIGFVQRVCGMAAVGEVTHHVLPFLFGSGQNGKSVLAEVLSEVLGDYSVALPSQVLVAGRFGHDTDLANLAGARLAICSEITQEGRFDEERVKMLTGGDRIVARRLYGNPFEFRPSHTLILHGNHQPSVESGGKSFWRRLRLIPFVHTVPNEKRIEKLADILVAEEGAGILAWIVRGAIEQAQGGLREPSSVMAATQEYESEEDSFGQFISECLYLAPSNPQAVKTDTATVRKAYDDWCRDNGHKPMSSQMFGREIKRRTDTTIARSNGKKLYAGIGLVTTEGVSSWMD